MAINGATYADRLAALISGLRTKEVDARAMGMVVTGHRAACHRNQDA
jgi:hypothetical protein